jgi:hypothetical protein
MTNTTPTTRPVVKSMKPELYVQHTFHMQSAISYTYNYSSLDDYILQNWQDKTQRAISYDTNELMTRVQYRWAILRKLELIGHKKPRIGKKQLVRLMTERKMITTWLTAIDKKLKGVV